MRTVLAIAALCAMLAPARDTAAGGNRVAVKGSNPWKVVEGALPADVKTLIVVNGAKARELPAVKGFLQAIGRTGPLASVLDGAQRGCGLDLLTSLESFVFALDPSGEGAIFLAARGLDHAALTRCVALGGVAPGEVQVRRDGAIVEYSVPGRPDRLVVAWPTRDVVAIPTRADDERLLRRMVGGAGAFAKSAVWREVRGRVRTDALAWAGSLDLDLGTARGTLAMSLDAAGGSDVDVQFRIQTDAPATAARVAQEWSAAWVMFQGQLSGGWQHVIKRLTVGHRDRDVTLDATIALDKLAAMIALF